MNQAISQKVLEKIKEEKVLPKPKWRFSLRRSLVGLALLAFLTSGSLAFSLIVELLDRLETGNMMGRPNGFRLLFAGLPYFWFLLLALASFLAVFDFLRTRNGYRYRLKNIALVFVVIIGSGGIVFYTLGVSDKMEDYLEKKISFYEKITRTPKTFWLQPDEGLLSGVVMKSDEKCHCLEMMDWNREIWNVDYSKADIRPKVNMAEGEAIKIIGEELEKMHFEAQEIKPWMGKRMMKIMENRENSMEAELMRRETRR
ncbi:MAG TPA: hypothetical protein PLK35_04125 [Candidatus Moranbacteria bacterium]|nr:hypothetical protein [Candidatus Moranbacteria bacterium]